MAKLRQRVIISQSHCSALHCDTKTFAGAKLRSSALAHAFIPYYILCIATERPWEWPRDGRGIFNVRHRRLDISTSLSMPASRHRSHSRQSDVSINIIGQRDEARSWKREFSPTHETLSRVSSGHHSRDDDIATCQFCRKLPGARKRGARIE